MSALTSGPTCWSNYFALLYGKPGRACVLLTETNVPHRENISYFGQGDDEAQLVYQFPLPPLTAHAVLKKTGQHLTNWASTLEEPAGENTYLNFLASHDGIGLRPTLGLLPLREIDFLVTQTQKHGGYISYKANQDGSQSPYELNINYFSLLRQGEDPGSLGQFFISPFGAHEHARYSGPLLSQLSWLAK